MNYNDVLAASADNATCPQGFNGFVAKIDVSGNQSHVADINKIVVSEDNTFSIMKNVGWACYCIQGGEGEAAAVTADHIKAANDRIKEILCIHVIWTVMNSANVATSIRASDKIGHAQYEAIAHVGRLTSAGRKVWNYLKDNEAIMSSMYGDLNLYIHSICANHMHRCMDGGHNWRDQSGKNSVASRCIAVAGARSEELKDFMERKGHDLWHFLDNATIQRWAHSIVGETQDVTTNVIDFGTERFDAGAPVADIFKVSEAAKDRIPVGELGKSSFINGIDVIKAMFQSLALKMKILKLDEFNTLLDAKRSFAENPVTTRNEVKVFGDRCGKIFATAVGYVEDSGIMDVKVSLANVTSKYPDSIAQGRGLAQVVKKMEVDTDAVHANIHSLMSSVVAKMSDVEANPSFEVNGDDIEIAMQPEERKKREFRFETAIKLLKDNVDPDAIDTMLDKIDF